MQSPPPFNRPSEGQSYHQAPKPKKSPLLIIFAVLGILFICCGAPLAALSYFGYQGFKGGMTMVSCYANTAMMSKALKSYEAANGGKLPPAATWQTDLAKYFKTDKDLKKSPFEIWTPGGEWSCGKDASKTGFMFNEKFGGKLAAEVTKANPEVPVIFETTTVAFNQAGKFEKKPFEQSPKLLEQLDEKRGWILVLADGRMGTFSKKDKFKSIDSSGGDGFNFNIEDSESNDSANSE